jgi:Transposase IS116/IS110/IS902 family
MAPLLAATQGAKLPQIRGVATVAAAGFVTFVGHTSRWSEWSKVWRVAGLDPARSQSGATDQSYGISREGSAWGRRAILDLAAGVCRQPGRFHASYQGPAPCPQAPQGGAGPRIRAPDCGCGELRPDRACRPISVRA